MTKEFEFRILEEKKRGRKLAIDEEGALSLLADHESLPDSGIIQIKEIASGDIVTRRIKQGKIV